MDQQQQQQPPPPPPQDTPQEKPTLEDFISQLTAHRKKNQQLSPTLRIAICTLVASGKSERWVADRFGISRHTVGNTWDTWVKEQTFESKPRSGRPECLTEEEKRFIIENRALAKTSFVNSAGRTISYTTIKRTLRAHKAALAAAGSSSSPGVGKK